MPRKKATAAALETTTPVKPRVAKAGDANSRAALLERFKEYPSIALIERQLSNPGDPGSVAILLKDESQDACVNSDHQWRLKPGSTKCHLCGKAMRKWHVRTINTGIDNRWSSVKNRGYEPVMRDEILDHDDIAGLVQGTADNYIRRGDAGKEILMKRPLELHIAIKHEQHARLNANMNSKQKMKDDLAEGNGQAFGDQAGQFVHEGGIKFESIKRTKTQLGSELESGAPEDDSIDEA